MNLASLQTITWGTVTAAVGSALLLASVGADQPPPTRRVPQPQVHRVVQTPAPQLAEAAPAPTPVLVEVPAKP
jgi:hypothetical protein